MPKSIIMLDKISKFVFLGIFLICLVVNGCTKNSKNTEGVSPVLSQSDTETERVEYDADEAEESDPFEYEAETTPKTKITVTDGQKDTYQHNTCDPSTNKYKDYYIGSNSFEIGLTLSRADTITSIVNSTGFYTASVLDATPTYVTMVITNNPLPAYKARNIKWTATFKNGKTANFYMKMIPSFSGNIYGSAAYHVNYVRWTGDGQNFNLDQQHGQSITYQNLSSDYVPTKFDIFRFGTTNAHYAIIATAPTKKIVAGKEVYTLKIKERNANCDWKATTKTFKWSKGMRIPSANTSRDSSSSFHRSY